MTDQADPGLLRFARLVAASDAGMPDVGPDCLDEIALAELAEGASPATRESALAHLASCRRCREQLAALMELLADAGVAAEVRRVTPTPARPAWRRPLFAAGLVAVAALLLLFVAPHGSRPPSQEHRGPTLTATPAPVLVSPQGDVPSPSSLTWRAVPDADRYRVTLFDASANLLLDVQTTDTTVALPDSIRIVPGRSYLWKVEARTSWDRWAASELIEFRAEPVAGPDSAPPGATSAVRPPRDSLRLIAAGLSDSALRLEARARPWNCATH